VLYFKVDYLTVADYTRAKMKPFKPYKDRRVPMKYYAVPLDVLESGAELVEWAGKAVAAAGYVFCCLKTGAKDANDEYRGRDLTSIFVPHHGTRRSQV
jgi:TfoX/Sxy family transcriptional regulator of competence genes